MGISFPSRDEPAKIESSHVQVVAKDIPASVNAVETNENLDTNMHTANNYGRPNGQNVDNFLTDRPSSKVCFFI